MAGRLGEANVSRYDGFKYLGAEMAFELARDLLRKRHAGIEHHPQQSEYGQLAIEVPMHFTHGVDEIGQSLEGVVLALHRDHHEAGRTEAVERE